MDDTGKTSADRAADESRVTLAGTTAEKKPSEQYGLPDYSLKSPSTVMPPRALAEPQIDEYTEPHRTAEIKPVDQVKPEPNVDSQMYGEGKPFRILIRGNLIRD